MDWDGAPFTMERLAAFAHAAEERGLDTLSVNDHFVFRRPWLDGLTALASVVHAAPTSTLMTSVALPVVRGPVAAAKALAAIDLLSSGRLIAGLGPGSTAADYGAVNIPFDERWARFDEAVRAIRALWARSAEPFVGRFYDTTGVTLAPEPAQPGGPQIFIGSWGSTAGLRRVARLGDGWLASAYNASPDEFAAARAKLTDLLMAEGRDATTFPNALVTMWLFITDDPSEQKAILGRLAELLNRDPERLADLLPVGPPAHCGAIVERYRAVGVDRILFWPLGDELRQLDRLAREVLADA
jgi:alkanesulfonate monooxygenase SsuD/methylene tetrahydromethanopterin reductase-like flavin-dependent oxidoreductase (luciferase family)